MKTAMAVFQTDIAQHTLIRRYAETKRLFFVLNYLKLYLNVTVMPYSTLLYHHIYIGIRIVRNNTKNSIYVCIK